MKAGWNARRLGEVCAFLNRGTSPKYLDDGGICVLNQKCVRDHEINYTPSRRHDSKAKAISPERTIRLGDVLVNSTGTGTLGRVAQVRTEPDEPTIVDSHITIVRPQPGMFELDFFGYMLIAIEHEIKEAGEGCGGQTELARSTLAERFTVSFPTSIPEQQRIVAILDDAFEGIATAKANAEKNLQNARELFESHLESVFTRRGEGWCDKHLKDVCEKITDGTHQTPTYFDKGVVFLSSRNVTSGTINWDNIKYIDAKQHSEMHKRIAPRRNDILLAKNGTTGVGAIVDRDVVFDIYVSLALLRAKDEMFPQFLLHFINSPVAKRQFNKRLKGIGVPNLHLEEIREVMISFPKRVDEQRAIAQELDKISVETKSLANFYERKLVAIEALKKSLLHQAFSGQL